MNQEEEGEETVTETLAVQLNAGEFARLANLADDSDTPIDAMATRLLIAALDSVSPEIRREVGDDADPWKEHEERLALAEAAHRKARRAIWHAEKKMRGTES